MNEKEILFEVIQSIEHLRTSYENELVFILNDINRIVSSLGSDINSISDIDLRLLLYLRNIKEVYFDFLSEVEKIEKVYKDKVCISLDVK